MSDISSLGVPQGRGVGVTAEMLQAPSVARAQWNGAWQRKDGQ